jgi:N-acetylglutamate synthase-like GNAT family acetyltransferase
MNQVEQFFVSSEQSLLQIERIHAFLSQKAYWCLKIPRKILENAIQNSINFGVYERESNLQVGYARIVTDKATFAWLCDVYIETEFQKKGLARLLMENVIKHPELKNLRRFCLATRDSHFLYEKFGFQISQTPNYWMEIKDNDLYKRMSSEPS